jgi:general secretion pathway protein K
LLGRPHGVRQEGFALLIVLWTLGLLGLIGAGLTSAARVQMRLAMEARDHAQAEAAADGAVREAIFILIGGGTVGEFDRPMRIRIGRAVVDIAADSETGKINPNVVSNSVMRRLLAGLGVDPPNAARIAGEIADWRTRTRESVLGGQKVDRYRQYALPYRSADRAFASVDEVALIPDMTPEIMERLKPWLSVYQEGNVSEGSGTTPAATAVGDAAASSPGSMETGFVSRNIITQIKAVAVVGGQSRFTRSSIIRIRVDPSAQGVNAAGLVQILTWD